MLNLFKKTQKPGQTSAKKCAQAIEGEARLFALIETNSPNRPMDPDYFGISYKKYNL